MEKIKQIINSNALTRDEWLNHIAAWADSKQTQANYCKAQGLSYHSFGYWRQAYLSEKKSKQPVGFSRVTRASEPKLTEPSHIRLNFPNGVAMLISGNPASEVLETLLNCLGDVK